MKIFNENSKLPLIISLCDHSGNWPKHYINNGYPVVLFDLYHGDDIVERQAEVFMVANTFENILGIIAMPPCTDYTVSGAQYWKQKDLDGRTEKSLLILDSCLEIINALNPKWWVLENPVGRIPTLRPELGKYQCTFDPCDYAGYLDENNELDNITQGNFLREKALGGHKMDKEEIEFSINSNLYNKKTCLWGNFQPLVKKFIRPIKFKSPQGGFYSPMAWYSGGKSEKTKVLRSATPLGFAKAFYEYNK